MNALAASLHNDLHAAPPADPTEVSAVDYEIALAGQIRRLTINDLLEELGECPQFLEAAIERKDADLIGRIVLGVRDAYTQRCAGFEVYGYSHAPTAAQAAALACIEVVL